MCVEVDLSKPLLPYYIIKGIEYIVEYEGLHSLCFSCGKFGHIFSNCSAKKETKNMDKLEELVNQKLEEEGGNSYGP